MPPISAPPYNHFRSTTIMMRFDIILISQISEQKSGYANIFKRIFDSGAKFSFLPAMHYIIHL